MAKTPSKGKKPAKEGAAPRAKKEKAPKAAAKPAAAAADEDAPEGGGGDEDDDEGEDEELVRAAKKPIQPAKPKPATEGGETPAVVPARRLTPEAKAKVNEMVAKGMSLSDALKAAASWETFVAPVKDEPAKLVQGKSFEGGGHRGRPRAAASGGGGVGGGGGGGGGAHDEDEAPEPPEIDSEDEPAVEAEE